MKHSDKSKAPASGWGRETPSSSQDRSRLPARLTWLDIRALCPRGLLLGIDRHSQRPPSPVLLELPLGRGNFCGVSEARAWAAHARDGHLRATSDPSPGPVPGRRSRGAPAAGQPGGSTHAEMPSACRCCPSLGTRRPSRAAGALRGARGCVAVRDHESAQGLLRGRAAGARPLLSPGKTLPASGLLVMQTLRDTHREAREQPRHRP